MKTIYCNDFLKDLKRDDFKRGCSLTMGNFDGCHLAHKKILQQTKEEAKKSGTLSVALTFDPHPRDYFAGTIKQEIGERIFSLEQKLEALAKNGIDFVILQRFTHEFSKLSHESFYTFGIKEKLQAKSIVIGTNFCFGNKRLGTASWLVGQGLSDGIKVLPVPLKKNEDTPVNSTQIRSLLKSGEIEKARELLGKPFCLDGVVVKGKQMGRKLGFPTANFSSLKQILPASGVYSGFLTVTQNAKNSTTSASTKALAVINVGTRPTVTPEGSKLTVEAHCLEPEEVHKSLYGESCRLYFHHRLRCEKKFASLEELQKQIQKDIQKAKSLHMK